MQIKLQKYYKAKILTEAIHGNKSQSTRQRALNNFKSKKTRVLVATDIAARGIDIDELSHVINFEIPNIPETYVHRIGRTGRAGLGGVAISLCDIEERAYLKDINKLISKQIPLIENHPFVSIEIPSSKSKKQVRTSHVRKLKANIVKVQKVRNQQKRKVDKKMFGQIKEEVNSWI